MATGTGVDKQIGYKLETTYGTGVVVTRFLPVIDVKVTVAINRIESNSVIAGRQVRTSEQWNAGNKTVTYDVQHELYQQSIGVLLQAALGTVTEAGTAAPYTHTFSLATPTGVSFTAQRGIPATFGSVIPETFTGSKIDSWEIAISPDMNVTWGMKCVAQEATMGTALAAASYAGGVGRPWKAQDVTMKIDGTVVPTKMFKFGAANNIDDKRIYLGSTVIAEPLRNDLVGITGEIDVEWGNPTTMGTLNYTRFLNGTESVITATLVSGTLSGTVTMNVRYDGDSPHVAGRAIATQNIPIVAVASGSLDSSALSIVLQNNDAVA